MISKVIIIGLDGGTLDILVPLANAGVMPCVADFFARGCVGELESVFPPMTGPGWVSFMTGKNPGNHGVFDFFEHTGSLASRCLSSYGSIRAETLWSMANRMGKRVGVFNVPVTYPPPAVDGFVVSGMLAPGMDAHFTHPAGLQEELRERFGPYILDVPWQKYSRKMTGVFVDALIASTRQKGECAAYLAETRALDVFMAVFNDTDSIQHALWNVISEEDPDPEPALRNRVLDYYRELDAAIGRVLACAGDDTHVFMMSDHGFGPLKQRFHLNRWLYEEGLLAVVPGRYRYNLLKQAAKAPLMKWLADSGIVAKIHLSRASLGERLYRSSLLHCVDWSKTRVFSGLRTEQGIYINVKGRQEHGTVNPGVEYERLRDDVIARLGRFMDANCDGKYVSAIRRREDVFSGPHVGQAPDIVFALQAGRCLADDILANRVFDAGLWRIGTGTHRMEGLMAARGPGIRAGARTQGARMVDLVPTILYSLGLPIPEDLDGRPVTGLYTDEFRGTHEMTAAVKVSVPPSATYSPAEEAAVLERLRGLGYVD